MIRRSLPPYTSYASRWPRCEKYNVSGREFTATIVVPAGLLAADAAGSCRGASADLDPGPRELRVVEVVVRAAGGEQLLVVALFDDPAVLHDQDRVRVADRREPVGDHETRAGRAQLGHRLLDQHLG